MLGHELHEQNGKEITEIIYSLILIKIYRQENIY
jgi:hypothetical protein